MGTTIYYFSGTGNSYKVAKDLNAKLENSKLVHITKKNMPEAKDLTTSVLGVVFPIYFNGIPVMVKEFLKTLQLNKNTYVFAIATFGASAGIAFNQIDDILKEKGISLSASFGIAMPGNYQVMYGPYNKEKQTKCFDEAKEQIQKIATAVKNKDKTSNKAGGVKKVVGKVLYSTFKPKDKDKNFWLTEKCNSCGTCAKICPANNIRMVEGKPQWAHACELCLACLQWCPAKSIQYKKSTLKRGRYNHPDVKISELF